MDKYTVNHQYFGHTLFREGQEQLIDSILARQDSFGIMPTGGGKSVCYQIPALLLPGLTLVISPLISLMKDQVSALHDAGISAAYWNSSMDLQEFQWVRDGVRAGEYKLLYIAPERLDNDAFLALMQTQEVSLVAVDEAHCVSQWGQDFRPSYLKIADFVAALPKRPVVAHLPPLPPKRCGRISSAVCVWKSQIFWLPVLTGPTFIFQSKAIKISLPLF